MKHIILTLLACVLLVTCIAGTVSALQPVGEPTTDAPVDAPIGGNVGGDVGYYEVTSVPSGADVHFDGSYKGTTPISIQVLTTGTPGHTISVSKTGYQTWTQSMPGNPAAGQTIAVTANLIAIPTTEPTITITSIGGDVGWYHITSVPSGADVTFDGSFQGQAPVTVQVYASGTPGHTLSVSKSGYQPWSQTLPGNPSAGQTIQVTANLLPVPTTEPTITVTSIGGDVGWYHITSVPSDADVTFDGSFWGETPVTVQVYTSATPGHTVSISKPGYQTWSQTLSGNPGAGQTIEVTASLDPLNPTGNIYVTSSPAGATSTLDSSDSRTTPASYTGVTTGYHTIQVYKSGYQSYSTSVNVGSKQTVNVNANLNPIVNGGYLQVISSPRGADLYVDGSYRGDTPITVGNLYSGNHNVMLRLAGYSTWQGSVNIQSGVTTTISPVLTPNPLSNTGWIAVSSQPAGANIYLDGNYQGRTESGESFDISDVAPGAHSISLVLNGYQDYSGTVMVSAGQTAQVSVTLTPSKQPGTNGNVVISSTPSGADAYLDNQYKGITPLTLTAVPPGTHTVTLKINGYADWSGTVQVNAGQTTPVTAVMTAMPTPTPTKAGLIPIAGILALVIIAILPIGMKRR